jgi:hypothetical protein
MQQRLLSHQQHLAHGGLSHCCGLASPGALISLLMEAHYIGYAAASAVRHVCYRALECSGALRAQEGLQAEPTKHKNEHGCERENTTHETRGAPALLLPAQNTHTLHDPMRDTERR